MTETRPVYHADPPAPATERRRAMTYAALDAREWRQEAQ